MPDTFMLDQALDGTLPSQIPMPIIQRTRAQTNAAGLYTWTYPVAFTNPPIISVIPEDSSAGISVDAKIVGPPTASSCIVQISKVGNVLGILTLQTTPGITWVHIVATAAQP